MKAKETRVATGIGRCFILPSSGSWARWRDGECSMWAAVMALSPVNWRGWEPKSRAWMPRLRSSCERSSARRGRSLASPITWLMAHAWSRLVTASSTSWSLAWRFRTSLTLAGRVREAARALRPMGRFVALFSHPCFDVPQASAWVVEHAPYVTTRWRKVSRYRAVFDVPFTWKLPSGEEVVTHSYHRPLSWYFRTLREAGFVVLGLEEPTPTPEFTAGEASDAWPDTPLLEQVPLHCILDARKMNGR